MGDRATGGGNRRGQIWLNSATRTNSTTRFGSVFADRDLGPVEVPWHEPVVRFGADQAVDIGLDECKGDFVADR